MIMPDLGGRVVAKPTSAEDYKLITSFEAIRKTLLDDRFSDRLDKPLAFWALPSDRRLPLAFLGRTLQDLLSKSFTELASTPGVGQKKIGALVKLLLRAAKEKSPAVPFGLSELSSVESNGHSDELPASKFDSSQVSESVWVQWRETVVRHNLGSQTLGRLAPALNALPTVIWNTPLSFYLDYKVAEIRQLKTHGEKRVRVVLEVFYIVNKMLQGAEADHHLAIRLVPRSIVPVETWLHDCIAGGRAPAEEEVCDRLVVPMLAQLKVDANETVYKLAEGRLGVRTRSQSVRLQSRKLGVTRARVYQLLDECHHIMTVRWPEGRCMLQRLSEQYDRLGVHPEDRQLFDSTRELLFPEKLGTTEE